MLISKGELIIVLSVKPIEGMPNVFTLVINLKLLNEFIQIKRDGLYLVIIDFFLFLYFLLFNNNSMLVRGLKLFKYIFIRFVSLLLPPIGKKYTGFSEAIAFFTASSTGIR
jgi:hypothetical protein